MSSHAEHVDALRALLVAKGDEARHFESSELATCAECARIVTDHRRVLDELERLAVDERASIAAAATVASTPGRAEAALREHILGPVAQSSRGRTRRWLIAALVAAAVVALAFLALRSRNARYDDDRVLGNKARLLHPVGKVDSFVPFRWDVELPTGGHFVVHVEGEGVDVKSPWLTTPEWTPPESSSWPAKIRWELAVYRASGPGDSTASYVEWAER